MLDNVIVRRIEVKTHTCIACGSPFKPNPFTTEARHQLCSDDNFWYEKAELLDQPNVARIAGHHYMIGEPGSHVKGMSGAKFTIRFYDGREVTTDNLWHQGKIPERWQDWLFNNAEFVKEAKQNNGNT